MDLKIVALLRRLENNLERQLQACETTKLQIEHVKAMLAESEAKVSGAKEAKR